VRLDLGFSVFVVPRRYVKGRKGDRVVVCNSVAQSIIESVREQHPDLVFVYSQHVKKPKYRPVESMNNTAWQGWARRCGLGDLRPHDMRHTVGMRLREAGVSEATRADILWHSRQGMTAHYSVAQVVEVRAALELITDEKHANNVSLASIIAAQKNARVPVRVPAERKTA
jgi:integrase